MAATFPGSRRLCGVESFSAVNATSNLSLSNFTELVQSAIARLKESPPRRIRFVSNFTLEGIVILILILVCIMHHTFLFLPPALPNPVVTTMINNEEVVVGSTYTLEFQRRRLLRCSYNMTSTLRETGSPVGTRWFLRPFFRCSQIYEGI